MAINVNILCPPHRLFIGHTGESNVREISFDVSAWLAEYPSGVISIIFERPDGELYPVVVGGRTSPVVWRPSFEDTAVDGNGKLEVRLTAGTSIGKTDIINTMTVASMGSGCGCNGTPQPDWVQEVANDAAEAMAAAERAEAAAAKLDGMSQYEFDEEQFEVDENNVVHIIGGVGGGGADGLTYNEETRELQLTADGEPIGNSVTVPSEDYMPAEDEEWVPMEQTVLQTESGGDWVAF